MQTYLSPVIPLLITLAWVAPCQAADSVSALVATSVPELIEHSVAAPALPTGASAKALRPHTETKRSNEPSSGLIPEKKPALFVERRMAEVRSLIERGLPQSEIAAALTDIVSEFPQNAEARLYLGREQIAMGNPQEALTTLAPLMSPGNPDWQPWFWVGTAYLAQNKLDQAKRQLETATAKNSRIAPLWVQLAVLSQELGEHSTALQYLLIAEQIDSNYGQLHLNRAYSLEHLRRPKEARDAYQRFLISDVEPNGQSLRVAAMQRIDTLSQGVEVASAARLSLPSRPGPALRE